MKGKVSFRLFLPMARISGEDKNMELSKINKAGSCTEIRKEDDQKRTKGCSVASPSGFGLDFACSNMEFRSNNNAVRITHYQTWSRNL